MEVLINIYEALLKEGISKGEHITSKAKCCQMR